MENQRMCGKCSTVFGGEAKSCPKCGNVMTEDEATTIYTELESSIPASIRDPKKQAEITSARNNFLLDNMPGGTSGVYDRRPYDPVIDQRFIKPNQDDPLGLGDASVPVQDKLLEMSNRVLEKSKSESRRIAQEAPSRKILPPEPKMTLNEVIDKERSGKPQADILDEYEQHMAKLSEYGKHAPGIENKHPAPAHVPVPDVDVPDTMAQKIFALHEEVVSLHKQVSNMQIVFILAILIWVISILSMG